MTRPVISRLWRSLRHAAFDARYGALLGGSEESRFADTGAHAVQNTDYDCLGEIFPPGEIAEGETLVDLGCGRGRVLNWWLSRYGRSVRIIGVELDPEVAARTRRRLRRFPNVEIITGSAPEVLDRLDPDVVFMFNPFGAPYMDQVEKVARSKRARIYYWHPTVLPVWQADRWTIELIAPPSFQGGHRLAKIRHAAGMGSAAA
jgi:SAM-dependent methyltransferase